MVQLAGEFLPLWAAEVCYATAYRNSSLRYCSKLTSLKPAIISRVLATRSRSAGLNGRVTRCVLRMMIGGWLGLPGVSVNSTCDGVAFRRANAALTTNRANGGREPGTKSAFRRAHQSENS